MSKSIENWIASRERGDPEDEPRTSAPPPNLEGPRPVRHRYQHTDCGMRTLMNDEAALLFSRHPKAIETTPCAICHDWRPVSEFLWVDEDTGEVTDIVVGS